MPSSDDPQDFEQVIRKLEALNLRRQALNLELLALDEEQGQLTTRLRTAVRSAQPEARTRYRPGQLVYIKNELAPSKILGSTETIADRVAIVSYHSLDTDRVTFTTLNGIKSNRQPSNVRPLRPGEEKSARAAARRGTA